MGAALATLLAGAGSAQAELIITFSQVGPDVQASGTGSLNFLDLNFTGFDTSSAYVDPSLGKVLLGTVPGTYTDDYVGPISGPASFGSGGNTTATSGGSTAPNNTGAGIDIADGILFVPGGYAAGSPFTVDATWSGTTISGLGLKPGTYTWTWGTNNPDSLEVIVPGVVPEPGSIWLMASGLLATLGLGFVLRRKGALAA